MTAIKCNTDLYNGGKCFTAGQVYETSQTVKSAPGLMDVYVINDLGERHLIGSWWREFEIIE